MGNELYYIFCIVVIGITSYHIYNHRTTLFCISNLVLVIFNLIFVLSPIFLPGNPIIYDIPLLVYLLVGFIIMYGLFQKRYPIKNKIKIIKGIKPSAYGKVLDIVIIAFACEIVYFLLTGRYSDLLTRNRSSQRLETYYDYGFDLESFINMIFEYFFFIIAGLCGERKIATKKVLLGFVLIAIQTAAVAEHRTPVVTPLILMIIFIHLYIKRLPAYGFVLVSIVVILFMAFSSYVRVGDISLAKGKSFEQRIGQGLRGLNTSESFYDMRSELTNGRLKYEYGYQFYLDIITPIPRFIWANKPNVSFSSRMTEKMYGRIDIGNWVRTFTVWGEGYAQFGFIGIILYSILLVLMLRKFIYFLSGYSGMEILLINFMVSLPFLIRADLFAVYSRILFIGITLLFIRAVFGFHIKKGSLPIYRILNS